LKPVIRKKRENYCACRGGEKESKPAPAEKLARRTAIPAVIPPIKKGRDVFFERKVTEKGTGYVLD